MLAETFTSLSRARLATITTGIPGSHAVGGAIGAVLDIGLILLIDMELHVHFILGDPLVLFLGMVIFLIAVLDNPFRGDVSVGPGGLQAIYDTETAPEGYGP